MKKIIFILLLSFTMGYIYSQSNVGSNYMIDWKDIELLMLTYPQTGANTTFEVPSSSTNLRFKFSKYTSDGYYRDQLTNYIIEAFAHVPCLYIETINYDENGSGGIIDLYLSENTESKKRRINIDGGRVHIVIDQLPR
ncbi:MAG: hypothetical protein LUG98_05365 [Tannerellaceae bacterium]|nr:hypothetical protein [Tannerellaceae bacterium]